MKIFAKSDLGKARELNEDAYYVPEENESLRIYMLADGMGGYNGGEIASKLAIESARKYLTNNFSSIPHDRINIEELIRSSMEYANMVVFEKSKEVPELEGMGTTVCVTLLRGDELWYAHVGDSRIYIYEPDSGLHLLTKDHSMVQGMVDQGILSEEEARVHPNRNRLVRVLGSREEVEPDVCQAPFRMREGMQLLLCSDGLSSYVPEEAVSRCMSENKSVREKCEELVALAGKAGGEDNVTVQLLLFHTAEAVLQESGFGSAKPWKRKFFIPVLMKTASGCS